MARVWYSHVRWSLVLALSVEVPCAAQTNVSEPRVELSGNVGALAGASTFTQTATFSLNAETEALTAQHGAQQTALVVDVGGGVRLAQRLWVQAAFTSGSQKADAAVSASLPHPLLFNR